MDMICVSFKRKLAVERLGDLRIAQCCKEDLRELGQQYNQSIEIWSLKVFEQKLNYIHQNSVEKGFVTDPIDWKYKSARNYGNDDQTVSEIDLN